MQAYTAEFKSVFAHSSLSRKHSIHPEALEAYEKAVESGDPYAESMKPVLPSIFHEEVMSVAWYSIDPLILKGSSSSDNSGEFVKISFDLPTGAAGYDYLMSSFIRTVLPALGVKADNVDTHRIAWCENIANEIVVSATVTINDHIEIGYLDNHILNMYPKHFMEVGFDDDYNIGQGNIPSLQTFSSSLHSHPIRADQPFPHCFSTSHSLPLGLLTSQSKVTHR